MVWRTIQCVAIVAASLQNQFRTFIIQHINDGAQNTKLHIDHLELIVFSSKCPNQLVILIECHPFLRMGSCEQVL